MTEQQQAAMRQALEALESCTPEDTSTGHIVWPSYDEQAVEQAITALRRALERPAQQEPVEYWTVADGWVSEQAEVPAAVWVYPEFWDHCKIVGCGTAYRLPAPGRQPLYTRPQAREPLTDEQILRLVPGLLDCLCDPYDYNNSGDDYASVPKDMIRLARAIEAAHGITGEKK